MTITEDDCLDELDDDADELRHEVERIVAALIFPFVTVLLTVGICARCADSALFAFSVCVCVCDSQGAAASEEQGVFYATSERFCSQPR